MTRRAFSVYRSNIYALSPPSSPRDRAELAAQRPREPLRPYLIMQSGCQLNQVLSYSGALVSPDIRPVSCLSAKGLQVVASLVQKQSVFCGPGGILIMPENPDPVVRPLRPIRSVRPEATPEPPPPCDHGASAARDGSAAQNPSCGWLSGR